MHSGRLHSGRPNRFLGMLVLGMLAITGASAGAETSLTTNSTSSRASVEDLIKAERFVQRNVSTPIDASPAFRSVVQRVLAGMSPTLVRAVEVVPPPEAASDSDMPGERTKLPTNAQWLRIHVVEPDQRIGAIRGDWEANLLAGAVRDLAASEGLPPIIGRTILAVLPDGSPTPYTYGVRMNSATTHSSIQSWTPKTLTADIKATAWRSGLSLASVTVQQPLGLAVVIKAVATDPSGFLSKRGKAVSALLGGSSKRFEGALVEVRDSSGTLLGSSAFATRAQTGVSWYQATKSVSSGSGSAASGSGKVDPPTPR